MCIGRIAFHVDRRPKRFANKDSRVERLVGCIPDDMLPPDNDSCSSGDDEDHRDQVCNPNRHWSEVSGEHDDAQDANDDSECDETEVGAC